MKANFHGNTSTDYISHAQQTLFSAKEEIDRLHNYMEPANKNASIETVETRLDKAIILCTKALIKRIEEMAK